MKAKVPMWMWWVVVAAAVVLAVREVSWLDDRTTEHRARRHADAIAKGEATPSVSPPATKRHFPIPISGFGPL